MIPQVDARSISNLQSPFNRKPIKLMWRIETDHICPNRRHSSNPPTIQRGFSFALPASKCSTLTNLYGLPSGNAKSSTVADPRCARQKPLALPELTATYCRPLIA